MCLSLENKNKLSRQLPLFTGWALSTQPLEEGEGLYRRLALLHPTLGGDTVLWPVSTQPLIRGYSALALLYPTVWGVGVILVYSDMSLLHLTL